jgi:hypothetical protein
MPNLINARYLLGEHSLKAVLADQLALTTSDVFPDSEAEVVVIIASAKDGISQNLINDWASFRESYIPAIVLILDFETGEVDFEDMSAIVGKMLEPVVTPYLVLHADNGDPIALINLEDLKISNYSDNQRVQQDSDPEHQELVADFAEELRLSLQEGGWEQFVQGLIVPAIPMIHKNNLGLAELQRFLDLIPSRS